MSFPAKGPPYVKKSGKGDGLKAETPVHIPIISTVSKRRGAGGNGIAFLYEGE